MRLLQVVGLSEADLQELLEALRSEGDLDVIGTAASLSESEGLRHVTFS